MFYESFLLLGVLSVFFVLPDLLVGMVWKTVIPGPLLWLQIFVVLFVYFDWLWKRNGQTLAMQTWKIRLEAADGAPLTHGRILLRYALAWPSLLACGIGLLWALVDRDRQFMHDRLAGTRLVKA